MQIKWVAEAIIDFEKHLDWYIKNTSVASKFRDSIVDSLESIKNNPYIARRLKEIYEIREFVVQKYPYLITYVVDEEQDTITIISFMHQTLKKQKKLL